MKIPVPQLLISFCISCCLSAMMPPNVDAEQSKEYFIQHPVSQSVTLNSTFTLACRFLVSLFQGASPDSPKPVVQWVRNKFGLGATREDIQEAGMETNSPISRYDLPYNLDEGQYDLQIRYATSLDEGKYVCQLHYGRNTYFSQTADVRVLVASEPPELAQSDASTSNIVKRVGPQVFATATEGTYMRLHCFARNGKPGPKLFWFLNGSPLSILYNENGTEGQITSPIEGNVSVKSISSGVPPFLVTTVSEIVVYVTKLHHGSKIQCNAQNEGYENHPLEPAYTKLNILYAPLVQMHISSVTGRRQLMENDVVNIRCSAEGRPDNFTWSWMINESLVEGENSDVYRIRLSREIINTTVTCIASTFAEGYKKTTLSFLC
uniref:Ig-like domain-containing protein n=1 Tax=Mesocestoides corti TaxID=53468 RepID=A0A5K3FLB5_MESCO